METGEFRIGGFLLVVILTGIDAAIQVREQLGDRLDALVVLAGWRVQRFSFFDIARFHGVGKGFCAGNQIRGLFGHISFIGGDGIAQAQQRVAFGGVGGGSAFNNQLAFRVGQQAAGHVVFTRLQVGSHLLAEARRDVLTLFHHHDPFEDLPLQRFLAVVLDDELGFTAVDRDGHRLTLFIIDGNFNLRNIRGLRGEC